jgi:hypothetical protein
MEVLELTAAQFIKAMSTGRNRPLLLGCADNNGASFEVVVKFRGREMNYNGQIAELVAAQAADDLGLQVPQPAVVDVPIGFETTIPDSELAMMVKGSAGSNFGSVHLGPGFTTWPPGRNPVGVQRDQAAEIFAFDTLVQNPHRRAANPNLWARSDRVGVFDHEQAFSFLALPIIGGSPKPWHLPGQGTTFAFLEQHIFYSGLRGGRLNLGPFKERLAALDDRKIQAYVDSVPLLWRGSNGLCQGIVRYLQEARAEWKKLIQFIQHLLR